MDTISIDERDQLSVTVVTNSTDTFVVRGRIRVPGGEFTVRSINHPETLVGDRSIESFTVPLVEGELETVLARFQSAPTARRLAYIEINLQRRGLNVRLIAQNRLPWHGAFWPPIQDQDPSRGQKVDNEADTTLGSNDTVVRTITLADNTKAYLYGGSILNADSETRAVTAVTDDGADELSRSLSAIAVTTGARVGYPTNKSTGLEGRVDRLPLEDGDRVLITWAAGGASAGGTAKSSAVWEEWLEPGVI